MCIISFQIHDHPVYKCIIAANRDEFYERPTAAAHFWKDRPGLVAGRDLKEMGTWLGITKNGRFAALTNYRDLTNINNHAISRGHIVTDFLNSDMDAPSFLEKLHEKRAEYNDFNLIAGSFDTLYYYSNRQGIIEQVSHGIHSVSNAFLNSPWPKVNRAKAMLKNYTCKTNIIDPTVLFDQLQDAEKAPDAGLPKTGIDTALEKELSAVFIQTPDYGTRCSTVILVDHDNYVHFIERTYHQGKFTVEKKFLFQIE